MLRLRPAARRVSLAARAIAVRAASAAAVRPNGVAAAAVRAMSSSATGTSGTSGASASQPSQPSRQFTADETKLARASGSESQIGRRVRISQPVRAATQQGEGQTHWTIEYDKSNQTRWTNPLMGWTSSNDTAPQLDLIMRFDTKQEAIDYAVTHGLEYDVLEPTVARKKPKAYADNFKYRKA